MNGICSIKDSKEQYRSDNIEIQVDQCRTLCVAGSTDTGDHSGNTGTDILSHDNGNCCAEAYCSGHTQCLQIPTDAEEDWITAVRTSPASTPNTGFGT